MLATPSEVTREGYILIEYCHGNKMARKGDTQQSQVIRKALEMYFDKLKVK